MIVVGVDEAGRGCWAGPLVAAAVILTDPIDNLNDSKQLSRVQRERLEPIIKQQCLAYGLGWVEPDVVDAIGLTAATAQAMSTAVKALQCDYDQIIIDGNLNYLPDFVNVQTMIKADKLVPAVSAASILAKVARDRYMAKAAVEFPDYDFDRHVGYGTALHLAKLQQFGPCRLHRLSYKPVKQFLIVKT
jgi:ribonuclease HII